MQHWDHPHIKRHYSLHSHIIGHYLNCIFCTLLQNYVISYFQHITVNLIFCSSSWSICSWYTDEFDCLGLIDPLTYSLSLVTWILCSHTNPTHTPQFNSLSLSHPSTEFSTPLTPLNWTLYPSPTNQHCHFLWLVVKKWSVSVSKLHQKKSLYIVSSMNNLSHDY